MSTDGVAAAPPAASARRYLRRGLPAIYQEGDFGMRFVGALETLLDPVVATLDNLPARFDTDLTDRRTLGLIAAWLGVELDESWPEDRQRELVKRQAEVEILPMALANGVAVAPYSPGAAGLLSGKYLEKQSGRLVTNKMYESRYGEPWMHEVAAKFVAFCRQRELHPVSTAVAWVAAHPAITARVVKAFVWAAH